MAELCAVNFDRVCIEDMDDWAEPQWEQSNIVFDNFYDYLQGKGLKEETAARKTNLVVFFVMKFLFVYCDDIESMLDVDDHCIKSFLGNWYIRKSLSPSVTEINQFLIAIADFYKFAHIKGFISKNYLMMIKEVCKDKAWFAERLRLYFDSDEDDFHDWLMDYNYDYI